MATNLAIEELQYEINPWVRKHPTIRLTWRTPASPHSPRDIEFVIYANDQEVKVVSGMLTSTTIKNLPPLKNYTFKIVTRDRRTKEEGLYYQAFEAFLGESIVHGVCGITCSCRCK